MYQSIDPSMIRSINQSIDRHEDFMDPRSYEACCKDQTVL